MSALVDSLASTTVRTVPLEGTDALNIGQLPRAGALSWLRGGEGMIGWGELARLTVSGPDRFTRARQWWEELSAGLHVEDSVVRPGTGPLAFASFSFHDEDTSVLVVPRVVVGFRDGRGWLTTTGGGPVDQRDSSDADPISPPGPISWSTGSVSDDDHLATVAAAVRRIRAGEVAKVVLSRDLLATAERPIDHRRLLSTLTQRYPNCWTFAVDGLIGATPEMLVRRQDDQVFSRVLAGTAWAPGDRRADEDDNLARELLASAKNTEEHAYAARSTAEALAPYCRGGLAVPDPSVLRLPNLLHLATDLAGQLHRPTSVLELTGALHPTSAVCGTPTAAATAVIRDIERLPRDRYSGPVGWVDSAGDGEFGIALRCALVTDHTARLYAGGGIVADSNPATELAETEAKLRVMREALTC